MSEQVPEEYHRVIENNFVTEGVNMGRMKNTDIAYDVANSEDMHRRYPVNQPFDERRVETESSQDEFLKFKLAETAVQLQTANVNVAIAKQAAGQSYTHPDFAIQTAYAESSKAVSDYGKLKNAVAKENSHLITEARKKDL